MCVPLGLVLSLGVSMRFTQIVVGLTSLPFTAEKCSTNWTYRSLFIQSSVGRHLGWFQFVFFFFSGMDKASMYIFCVSVDLCFYFSSVKTWE